MTALRYKLVILGKTYVHSERYFPLSMLDCNVISLLKHNVSKQHLPSQFSCPEWCTTAKDCTVYIEWNVFGTKVKRSVRLCYV